MKTIGSALTLVLTGNRQRLDYEITVDGKAVWLPEALFKAFLALVLARLSSDDGFVRLSPTHIFRIRRAIGQVIGEEQAYGLIDDARGSRYALTVDRRHISVGDRFRTAPLSDAFLKRTRAAILRLIDRRSPAGRSSAPRSKSGRQSRRKTH